MSWDTLIDVEFSGRLCLTLFHSVWQVAVLAAAAWAVDRVWGRRSVERSYALYVTVLLASLAAMPITYAVVDVAPPTTVADSSGAVEAVAPVPTPMAGAFDEPSPAVGKVEQTANTGGQPAAHDTARSLPVAAFAKEASTLWLRVAPWIVALYAAGVLFMLARLIACIWRAQRLGSGAQLIADGVLVDGLNALARNWSMRVVPALARVEQIAVPKVVGLARPTILLPASAITGLSPGELEMILAHELAHVRRYDMWVNLLQRFAEVALFFNPALWYLSRRISMLREYCCDELTCRATSDSGAEPRMRYASALLRVVELSRHTLGNQIDSRVLEGSDVAALAASGRSPSELRRRVARLFGEPLREPVRLSRGGVLTLAVVAVLLVMGPSVWQSAADFTAERPADAVEDGADAPTVPAEENTDGETEGEYSVPITVSTTARPDVADDSETSAAAPAPSDEDNAEDDAEEADNADTPAASDEGNTEGEAEKIGGKGPILRGRITDDTGKPLPGVRVVLFSGLVTRFRGQDAITDDGGKYEFESLSRSAIVLTDDGAIEFQIGMSLEHDNYVPADGKSWHDLRVRRDGVHDFKMVRGGKISGAVVDAETGQPVSNLALRIHDGFISGRDYGDFMTYATTDADGTFVSKPLFPGRYVIAINDNDFQGKHRFPKIGKAVVASGKTTDLQLTTRELPELQDPFRIIGTTKATDGKSMVYGGVHVRFARSDTKLRSTGGGIDGRNVFSIHFGPTNRTEPSPNSPYGVGTRDVELVGRNHRFGYELIKRTPSEPLRITDDPNQAEFEDGVRYILPNRPMEFELVFAKENAGGAAPAATSEDVQQFALQVVGPDGKPVPQANVEIRTRPIPTDEQIRRGDFLRKGNYGAFVETDADGRLEVELPAKPSRFNVNITTPGYGPYWTGWDADGHPQRIPSKFVARLEAGWTVGGVIVDSDGAPIEGVMVHPDIQYKKRPGDVSKLGVGTRIATDAEGKWNFDCVPNSMGEVFVSLNHPDFMPVRRPLTRSEFGYPLEQTPRAKIVLEPGLMVTGTVTNESGQPVAGALVRTQFLNDVREATTDERGHYRLTGCEPRMAKIVVSAKGRAIDMQEVRVDPEMEPVDFKMQPGGHVRIRVVDEQDNPIPKARILIQHWRGWIDYFEFDHVSQYADENGVWEWDEAPLDEFKADICRPGGMQLSRQSLIAREEEYVFRPARALVVTGKVLDAVTKAPIETFRVIPGLRNSDPRIRMNWIPRDSYQASDGQYRIRLTHAYPAHLVRIEADGYQVAISRDIMTDEGEVTVDFQLQPAKDIAATIRTASGEPAAGAKIALGVAGSQISVENGDIDDGSTNATRSDADQAGRFSFPGHGEPFQLVITHPSGFAYLKSTDGPVPPSIALTPWARVEGTFRVGTQPVPNVGITLDADSVRSYGDDVPSIFTHHDVTTQQDGRFVFERVFPGKGYIGRRLWLTVSEGATEVTSSTKIAADFPPGETTRIDLGGAGRPVVGKLRPPDDFGKKVLWSFALVNVRSDLSGPKTPEIPDDVEADPEKRKAWWQQWLTTDEGKAWKEAYDAYDRLRSTKPHFTATIDRDGAFRIDDMPAGDYVLRVRFSEHSAGRLSGYRFSLLPIDGSRMSRPLDLGVLALEKK